MARILYNQSNGKDPLQAVCHTFATSKLVGYDYPAERF
jgi:hypothetical protein